MTTAEAIKNANTETLEILKASGLENGDGLGPEGFKTGKVPLFWHLQIHNTDAARKELYVIWATKAVDAEAWADNKPGIRTAYVAIDIYTNKPRNSKDVEKVIADINNQAIAKGWAFEMSGPDIHDDDVQMLHLAFEMTKRII